MLHQMLSQNISDEIESFMVHNAVDLTLDSLNGLRPGQWLDMCGKCKVSPLDSPLSKREAIPGSWHFWRILSIYRVILIPEAVSVYMGGPTSNLYLNN